METLGFRGGMNSAGLPPSDAENMPDVAGEAQTVQDGEQIQEGLVVRVVSPAFDGDAICAVESIARRTVVHQTDLAQILVYDG